MNGPMRYAKDPVLFLREVLDMDPDEWQSATAKDVQDHAKVLFSVLLTMGSY